MSGTSLYESNIDFLLKAREEFPHVGWTTLAVSWSSPSNLRGQHTSYAAAQVSDALSVWMWKSPEELEQNIRSQAITQLYRGWPVEIRQTLPPPPKPLIDYSAITKEICGKGC